MQSEQTQQLRRVREAIATHVIKFIDTRAGKEFFNADLHNYVSEKMPIAPGSADRILRDLKSKGVVRYELRDRSKSLYYVPMEAQRSLF